MTFSAMAAEQIQVEKVVKDTTDDTALEDVEPQGEVVANLYRHDCPNRCCASRWSRYPNHEEEMTGILGSTTTAPIVHNQRYCNKKWVTQTFSVQDAAMRAHLHSALANYQDFDLNLVNYTFKPPFSPLVHRWDRLEAPLKPETKASDAAAIANLIGFLRPILGPSVEALARTRETGKVTFDNVWHIFPPGGFAITTMYGVEGVCRITKHEKIEPDPPELPYWEISLEYLDWNGANCGYTNTKVVITHYEGFRHVVSLPVYPLSFHKSADAVRTRMVERGRKFEALRGYHFRSCVGTKILLETKEPEQKPVSGRVAIDSYAYYRSNDIVQLSLKPLDGASKERGRNEDKSKSTSRCESSDESYVDGTYDDDEYVDEEQDYYASVEEGPEMKAVKSLSKASARVEVLDTLTDEQCLLATPWVRGLDLQTKQWALFNVDELTPIVWNDAAFEHLVLPGNEKQLAWQFVENKTIDNNNFDDFVADKGRGIIVIMYGPPGVGKTFTAEAVAERARVPLYSMSAGTLGINPKEVESSLERALDLCELWNAMLLLDEADVFLAARNHSDIARNELVAIFLTKLEYYPGVCFLTTNRIASLDHAFQSRVDLFLPYTDLTVTARRKVWENFVNRTGRDKFTLTGDDFDTLAQMKLNGREIKNLIKSANLLSLKSSDKISMDRVQSLAVNRIQALNAMEEL